jgi:hypothetical protein
MELNQWTFGKSKVKKQSKDVHALVSKAVVSEMESQDIAVIEIEKNGPQSAMLQIIGNEDIFGES